MSRDKSEVIEILERMGRISDSRGVICDNVNSAFDEIYELVEHLTKVLREDAFRVVERAERGTKLMVEAHLPQFDGYRLFEGYLVLMGEDDPGHRSLGRYFVLRSTWTDELVVYPFSCVKSVAVHPDSKKGQSE